ncbi:unnamed protein product [Urochloa decumbens]|uniref:Protein kinase domain-containing protein n=1 Tax=Urochloa decumbens TaxID=240449 RepID=A0ABC9E7D3_9POAL
MDGEYNIHELDSILQDGSSEPQNLPLEYLRKITNNFADDRLLGEGGFGKVYKGVLQNGKLVAVKKLDQLIKLGIQERQFENEVYHLIRLKHPNIVRFIGYCYETRNECVQHNGKYIFAEMQQKLICLEYMPNGSLDRHLSDESSGHDWHTRYKIIKGICCGLHYLHEECQCQFSASIIHLDLKPANILLDDNMGPKVADFGLSRLFEDSKTHTCATFLSGSLGYMAPEYVMGRIVTTKADVYNLGVIIMEIITGSKVNLFSYSSPTSWQDFVERVLEKWRSRLEGAPSETDCKQIKCCLEIGLDCIKFNREERPTSREIIEKLDRWESTHCYINNEEGLPADQPEINGTRATAGADNNDHTRALRSCGSPKWTSARGLFRGQLSRIRRRMARQLWCVLMARGPSSLKKFTLAQLKVATFGFALEAKIGEGSFGTVYHGKLPNGREVAIKRRESGPRARRFQESAFRSQLAFLSHCHHRHIVGLVGYCEENKERLLVHEYMKNGSLYDHLHPKAATPSMPSPVVSSWKLRVKILLDASRGIEYLHAKPSVIHRDIKSSNILLDVGWTARVSGFGLALMVSEAQDQDQTVKIAGTAGYVDPQCFRLRHLSVKMDVYGFGVVMLEVLTGKRAIFKEAEGGDPVNVVDYAVPIILAGELGKILDLRAPEPAANEAEAVELVAYTAVHCVRLEGKDRPAMADIVANLETALALCEGTSGGGGFGHSSSSASASVSSMDRENELV